MISYAEWNTKAGYRIGAFHFLRYITLRNIKQSVQFNIKKSPFVLKKKSVSAWKSWKVWLNIYSLLNSFVVHVAFILSHLKCVSEVGVV